MGTIPCDLRRGSCAQVNGLTDSSSFEELKSVGHASLRSQARQKLPGRSPPQTAAWSKFYDEKDTDSDDDECDKEAYQTLSKSFKLGLSLSSIVVS